MKPIYRPPGLPSFLGVHSLSRTEIKKDLAEIIPSVDEIEIKGSDSDSDISSVDSRDIRSSHYPVKPRTTPKCIPKKAQDKFFNLIQQNKQSNVKKKVVITDFENEQVIETLELLKLMEKVRPELFEAEKSREKLETQYQVFFNRHQIA